MKTLIVIVVVVAVAVVGYAVWSGSSDNSSDSDTETGRSTGATDKSEALREALAKKYNRNASDYRIVLGVNSNKHVVATALDNADGSGAYVLGAYVNGKWMIVYDGFGGAGDTAPCEDVEKYNFPKTIVPKCVSNTGATIFR